MDPVRVALHAILTAYAPLTALLADGAGGVYHRRALPHADDPLVTFQRRSEVPHYLFGSGQLDEATWIVKGVARGDDAQVAEQVGDAIDAALHDAQMVIVGHTTLWIRRLSIVDYEEPDGQTVFNHYGGIYRLATEPA